MSKAKVLTIGRDWLNEPRKPSDETNLVVRRPRKLPKKAHSPQHYAEIYSVDEDTITKAIRQGYLEASRIGGVWRISEEAWFDYLEKQSRRKGIG